MTVGGTIHFNDESDFESYQRDPHWQHHEEGHLDQDFQPSDVPSWLFGYAIGALLEWMPGTEPSVGGPTGHDYNVWEIWAESYARDIDGTYDFQQIQNSFFLLGQVVLLWET